ncbi:FtsX-like permease family protein [Actinoplanes sp. CA-142083]|uniref:FtsX-like permease family protein n=1 Tax=Actinoplanes sp. CA-142083 TaxID=3239903 RepID=UPI003D92E7D7
MWRLVIGLVRARPAQVLTMLVLTALAAGVAAAGPWFAYASMSSAAAADVAAAPAEQRTLSVRQNIHIDGDPRAAIDRFVGQVRDMVALPSAEPVTGLTLGMNLIRGLRSDTLPVAYRDEFCAHVQLQGPCPAAPGEVAISATASQRLGLRPGDQAIEQVSLAGQQVRFRIVSIYTPVEPDGPYWSNRLFRALTGFDPVFTPIETFRLAPLANSTVTYDVQVPEELLRSDGGYDLASVLNTAGARMGREELSLINASGPLLTAVARDRSTVRTTVTVSLVQVLIVAWFAIGLAGRYTARDRRGDTALLKLRGATPAGLLQLAWGQHLVPLIAGAIAGLPLGFLMARTLAGAVGNPSDRRSALLLSVAAALAVLLGGLLVLAVLEALAQRRPVAELLRHSTSTRGDWKSGLIDLLLLAVAVGGIYQARVGNDAGGFALAAPALVALAVAVLLARLLFRVADRGGGAALRSGRLRLGLTAAQMSRRPGADRLFALVVVAVAMFTTALGGWLADGEHRAIRSAAELGAQRVLTVQATNRTALQEAVRRADPQGRQAMAVVVDTTQLPAVLAVDSSRLAAVARWRPDFGSVTTLPSASADDPGPAPAPSITGDRLTVRVTHTGDTPAALGLVAQHEGTGVAVRVSFGVLGAGEQTVSAPVTGCTAAPGCRIVRWEVTAPGPLERARAAEFPTTVTVRGLTQENPTATVLDGAAMSDIDRWRGGASGGAMDIDTSRDGLRMAVDENLTGSVPADYRVWAVDVGLPLPVVLGGAVPDDWRFGEPGLSLLGDGITPVRVAGTARALPVLGSDGVLADLDATRRIIGDAPTTGTFQVWLSPDAGPGVIGALERNGLAVLHDESVTGRASRLAHQGPSAGSRFMLLATSIGLLLAALSIAVAGAVDWRTRLGEMTALRVQGLPHRAAVVASWAGTAGLVLAAVAGGLIAATLARPLARTAVPPFSDGWAVLAPPGPLSAAAVALAALVSLVLLGLAGWLSTLALLRRVREGAP